MCIPARAACPGGHGIGGLLEEGLPVALLGPSRPLVAIETREALARFMSLCAASGLVVGEKEETTTQATSVGYLIDTAAAELAHKPGKSMVYRGLRFTERFGKCTGHMMKVIIGHLLFFFMLNREALVSINHCYSFVKSHRGDNVLHVLPARVVAELKVVRGLIFVSSVRSLSRPHALSCVVATAAIWAMLSPCRE